MPELKKINADEARCESPSSKTRPQSTGSVSRAGQSPSKKYLTKKRIKRVLTPGRRPSGDVPNLMDHLPDSPPRSPNSNQEDEDVTEESTVPSLHIQTHNAILQTHGTLTPAPVECIARDTTRKDTESVADMIQAYNKIGSPKAESDRDAKRAELEKYIDDVKNKVDSEGRTEAVNWNERRLTQVGEKLVQFPDSSATALKETPKDGRETTINELSALDAKRKDLQAFLDDMKTRVDSDGEKLVQFPNNFEEVVSLMSEEDLSARPSNDTKVSWVGALLNRGLQKTFAIKDQDEEVDREKLRIAKGIAMTRKLDKILAETERKLKKPGKRSDAVFLTEVLNTSRSSSSIATSEPALSARSMPAPRKHSQNRISHLKLERVKKMAGTKSSASLTSRNAASPNFLDRNRELAAVGAKSELTKEDSSRLEMLLNEQVESEETTRQNDSYSAYAVETDENNRISDIDQRLEAMIHERKDDAKKLISDDLLSDLKIEFGSSGDVIRQQAGERLLANKLRDINKAISEIKAADAEDFEDSSSERPGTSFSRMSMRTVQPEDLQLLLKRAKEEVPEEKKASPDDIKQLLEKLKIQ